MTKFKCPRPLISHECPMALFNESRQFNDYDYALVHLFKDAGYEYLQYFADSLKQGRTVYLDNSLFELREMYNHEAFAEWCKYLGNISPNCFYYIIPDAFEDCDATIESFDYFTKTYWDLPGYPIAVVQGKTIDEIKKCFNHFKGKAEIIAIPLGLSLYLELGEGETIEEKYATGRKKVIDQLDITDTQIHLLGCWVPQDFKQYVDIPEILSIDTSNPIVHGIKHIRYTDEGLKTKENTKLADLIKYVPDKEEYDDIMFNIKKFKLINWGDDF